MLAMLRDTIRLVRQQAPRRRYVLLCLLPWTLVMLHSFYLRASEEWFTTSFSRPRHTGPCVPGIWNMTLRAEPASMCNIKKKRKGIRLCDQNGAFHVVVQSHECDSYHIGKVGSCTPEDLKCRSYNCKKLGVLRLESSDGELVDVGSDDKMLTCGNVNFSIVKRRFCPEDDGYCTDRMWHQHTWTTTTTTYENPIPQMSHVFDVISASGNDTGLQFGSCALVGTSSMMRGRGYGAEIDEHDTVIRVNRLPIGDYFPDFGERTDLFFTEEKHVEKTGFNIEFMDGEQRQCGTVPNRTNCAPFEAFAWLNVQSNQWVEQFGKHLEKHPESMFIGATKPKVACIANLLLNQNSRMTPTKDWQKTTWREQSTGFGAFLVFGYLCRDLRLYGFGGVGSADAGHGAQVEGQEVPIRNFTRDHDMMNKLISGQVNKDLLRPSNQCTKDGVTWLRRALGWFSQPGRITFAGVGHDSGAPD